MDENLEKFLKVDKYKKELKEADAKKKAATSDTAAIKAYDVAKEKLDKASANYIHIHELVVDYDKLGAPAIAKKSFKITSACPLL